MNRGRFLQSLVAFAAATTGFVQIKTRATVKSRVVSGTLRGGTETGRFPPLHHNCRRGPLTFKSSLEEGPQRIQLKLDPGEHIVVEYDMSTAEIKSIRRSRG